jgi:3-hydroxyisobutyrate dehydrogenase
MKGSEQFNKGLDVPAPLSAEVAALWDEALAALGPAADHTAIDEFVAGKRSS